MKKFPKNFYWGTATSAYQVEGGIKNDWSAAGGKYDAGIACDHYNRFKEDFDLAKQMNNNALRFSIEWARIEPEQGKFDQKEIEHYRKVILALRERGLEPFVTLYHWTLPVWFIKKGHWLNKNAPKYFERFVEKVVKEYKNLVKFWITLNEPNVYTSHSFLRGNWPPFKKSLSITNKVLKQLEISHKKSYKIIHKISPEAQVGIAKCEICFKGILRFLYNNYYWNYKFLNKIKDYQDFIGLNYYFSHSLWKKLSSLWGAKLPTSDLGWGIHPEGIYHVLKDLKKYDTPIYITENGLADAKDKKRAKFIIEHLKWVHKAIEEGVDVRGYFHWSLLDNFEWDKGFKPRFGLIEVDYSAKGGSPPKADAPREHASGGKTLERKIRPSAYGYAEICKNNGLNI